MHKLLFLTLLSLLLSGCVHDDIDWRDTYVGEWQFNSIVYLNNWNYIGEHTVDTIEYIGSVVKGSADSSVFIHYAPISIRDFFLNQFGELYNPKLGSSYNYYRIDYGSFSDQDNVTFTLKSGGIGSNRDQVVTGKRIQK
jgi:hypothetical protein